MVLAARTLLGCFASGLLALHLAVPELTPDRHMISEYGRTSWDLAWICSLLAWAASLSLTSLIWWGRRPHDRLAQVVSVLLGLASVGLVLAAGFRTQTSAGDLAYGASWSLGGRLHDAGAGRATVCLLGTAVVAAADSRLLGAIRASAAAVVTMAVTVQAALLAVGDGAGGIRQRVIVGVAIAWQLLILAHKPTLAPSQ